MFYKFSIIIDKSLGVTQWYAQIALLPLAMCTSI